MTGAATDCDLLLAGVLANPADDVPRLVMADWLDEHDEPKRAEFIRVQCELARLPAELLNACDEACRPPLFEGCPQRALRRREHRLFSDYWREPGWGGGLLSESFRTTIFRRTFDGRTDQCALVSRGFVGEIRLPLSAFLAHAADIFRRHPVEQVVISDAGADIRGEKTDSPRPWRLTLNRREWSGCTWEFDDRGSLVASLPLVGNVIGQSFSPADLPGLVDWFQASLVSPGLPTHDLFHRAASRSWWVDRRGDSAG